MIIDITKLDRTDWGTWSEYWGVEVINAESQGDDELIVYKAVDGDLKSGRGFAYPIGETVTDSKWAPGDFCGSGLHFSPRPHHALRYFSGATRFLEVAVKVSELSIIGGNDSDTPKLKARSARVLREVTFDGVPVAS